MKVNVYLRLGKELTKATQATITEVFQSNNLEINDDKPTGKDKVAFIIKKNVADQEQFVECVYKTLQSIPKLYVVAPQKCLDRVKHHPGVHCFDSQILNDPEEGINNIIQFAYHGRPL